jgi:hypothetical protein
MPRKRYDKNSVLDVVHIDHLRIELGEDEPLLPDAAPSAPDTAPPPVLPDPALAVAAAAEPDPDPAPPSAGRRTKSKD